MELSREYGFTVETDEADLDLNKAELDEEQREKQEQFKLIKLLDRDE